MILVCVGASDYKFDRLLKIIDELCQEKILNGKEVIAQIGNTDYIPRNYKYFDLIGRDEFQEYINQSDLVITHAGTGCVLPPLKQGKKVIVFPRLEKNKEHLDDHQLELSEAFSREGYTMKAETKEELISCIKRMKDFQPKLFISNSGNINELVIRFIEKI